MRLMIKIFPALPVVFLLAGLSAEAAQEIVDIPTRPGVTQRVMLLEPDKPQAAVILFAGGHGGLQISEQGSFKWGGANFLIRTRQMFADQGLLTVVVDAPSDRQTPPYLAGFRQTPEHLADITALIAWLRERYTLPVWLVGTSRGTQSAAFVATELSGTAGPDGLVLSSTILTDDKGRPVSAMPLDKIRIPVLVLHHEQDACKHCAYQQVPLLMEKLGSSSRKQLLAFHGGINTGDPCEPFAYHGFNGIEHEVVEQLAAWILEK